ncbi:MAG: sigma-54 dependent transcriptional regulator [Ignavibacteriales bacterium]|nr:MAG: sigma-54-dependent Fis family transcriptional regulator [Ignavibacteriaceae bacterium]MBW7871992.1 sigma-54-dependent Fis family transcriptional regulator [Ignavibacteria bacterium]MCZ2144087.1 sigma-54 dependent transcriptional regulator [Ignavibacteriales bacterium]OQY76231.1 MAG: Fis family transcriptional regulator [Ignavibacteriales bacterium UTCHB3]MBV6446112.1 Transcriptional regulatory protein ZraR [Ignavibacteriaceae bacterium]
MVKKILVVDDEKIFRESLFHWFEEEGFEVIPVDSGEEALKVFDVDKFDIILLDIKMPGMSGLELLAKIKQIDPNSTVIMITAFASVSTAIQALKEGAYDYVTKPVDPDELTHLIHKALKDRELLRENIKLRERIDDLTRPENLIGESPGMKKIYELINTVANADTTVLIYGESGTGKELVAKAIHINSPRKYFPMITVNCGALTESLLESELFGHERGAFTGAQYKRKGKFEIADNGTIFLDEIGLVSPKTQIDLLRVIETKHFSRVGGNDLIESNFRVICATNEPLEQLVKEGRFREDLFYRLNVFSITIPPLRERKDDIPLLIEHFLKKFSDGMSRPIRGISRDAMDFLMNYDWPGNVRELENAIERAVVIRKSGEIKAEDLPFDIHAFQSEEEEALEAVEKNHIVKMLEKYGHNVSKVAKVLGIDRVTLYNKMNKYKIERE